MANKQHKYNILREEITQQQQTIQANRKQRKRHGKNRKKGQIEQRIMNTMSKKNIQPSQKHFSKKLIQLKCSLDTKTKSKKIRITLKSVIANMVTY